MLVVFEGVDGSGKSTQVLRTTWVLTSAGHTVASFAFPDRTTQIGQRINAALKRPIVNEIELYHLFVANRFEKLDALRVALASHDFVLVDRYSYSGIVYTRANGNKVDIEDALAADIVVQLPPHKVLYMSPVAPPAVKESYDRLRAEVLAEYERVWEAARDVPLIRVPVMCPEETTNFIIECLTPR
jgi:dTMP kinase